MNNIAVCISTRNRPKEFNQTYRYWLKHSPENTTFFVVDDNSDLDYAFADFKFNQRVGIPTVKNKCLELAYNHGAEHIFLSDDDAYPITNHSLQAYINANCNHLSFSFQEQFGSTDKRNPPIKRNNFLIHETPNGSILYFNRICLDTVGGFNTNFGLGSCEHIELTRRIYNAKLTPYPNMDIINSNELFYSLDQHNKVKRSFSPQQRKQLIRQNNKLLRAKYKSKEFIPFF